MNRPTGPSPCVGDTAVGQRKSFVMSPTDGFGSQRSDSGTAWRPATPGPAGAPASANPPASTVTDIAPVPGACHRTR